MQNCCGVVPRFRNLQSVCRYSFKQNRGWMSWYIVNKVYKGNWAQNYVSIEEEILSKLSSLWKVQDHDLSLLRCLFPPITSLPCQQRSAQWSIPARLVQDLPARLLPLFFLPCPVTVPGVVQVKLHGGVPTSVYKWCSVWRFFVFGWVWGFLEGHFVCLFVLLGFFFQTGAVPLSQLLSPCVCSCVWAGESWQAGQGWVGARGGGQDLFTPGSALAKITAWNCTLSRQFDYWGTAPSTWFIHVAQNR